MVSHFRFFFFFFNFKKKFLKTNTFRKGQIGVGSKDDLNSFVTCLKNEKIKMISLGEYHSIYLGKNKSENKEFFFFCFIFCFVFFF